MSSRSAEPIAAEELRPIAYRGEPVITTKLLAKVYGTSVDNISQNYSRNKERFEEGEHRFTVEGEDLAELRRSLRVALKQAQSNHEAGTGYGLTLSQSQIATITQSIVLWTKRGAIRHAKLLGTDEAWQVFKKLEDAYFTLHDGASTGQPRRFNPSSGDLSKTRPEAYSKRFWEEAERLGFKDPKALAAALGWGRSKLWQYMNMNVLPKKPQDFHVLIGLGFDLRYLIYGERTVSRAELDLIAAYRDGDTAGVRRIAAARPPRLTDQTDGET